MLYVVATPIGNREDITLRALRILGEVDFILAEDTRKTGVLLDYFSIKTKLISFHEHNEDRKSLRIIKELKEGKNIALVSNAGTPLISDPGFKLVRKCKQEKIKVVPVPGASSIITALSASSIGTDKFAFFGYLSRKKTARLRLIKEIANLPMTLIFFESPYRVLRTLEEMMAILGNRKVAVGRELTKKFEDIFEADLKNAINYFGKQKPKGEFVIILDRKQEKE